MTPSRSRLLTVLTAASELAERDGLTSAAWLLSCMARAVIRGNERELALAWAFLEAEESDTPLDVGELARGAGTDGAAMERLIIDELMR